MRREKLAFRLFWVGVILTFYFSGIIVGILATISGLIVIGLVFRSGSSGSVARADTSNVSVESIDDGIDDYTLRKHQGLTRVEI